MKIFAFVFSLLFAINTHAGLITSTSVSGGQFIVDISIDNIEQDVPEKSNQFYNRGVIPDYEIPQTFEGFLNNKDTQLEFVLELIKMK